MAGSEEERHQRSSIFEFRNILEGNFSMEKFMFSVGEISAHSGSKAEWHDFVRSKEVDIALSLLPANFENGLEIGAGDGGQSEKIKSICNRLVCTELDRRSQEWLGSKTILERNVEGIEYMECDAQDLSYFENLAFDFIYSSNVLEHIPDTVKCFTECRRVLGEEGVMLHTMPSRHWKIFNAFFFLLKLRRPLIHGEYESHIEEFKAFGRPSWEAKFERAGFSVVKVAALPFYLGHGHQFSWMTILGNLLGFPGSYLYLLEKN